MFLLCGTVCTVREMAEGVSCCSVCCRKECRCSSLGLNHPKPYLFAESHWQGRPNIPYVVYRVLVAMYMFVWLVLSGTGKRNDPTWFIYMTYWNFLILNIRLVLQACIALAHYIRHSVQGKAYLQRLNWTLKTEWVLYNISSGGGLLTSLLFWIFIYLPDPTSNPDLVNIHAHGVNSVVILLDIWIAAIPLRILHFFQPTLFILIYFIFNGVYVVGGGKNRKGESYIYPGFKWLTDPKRSSIGVAGALAGTALGWVVLWLLSWLVRWLAVHCCHGCSGQERRKRGSTGGQEQDNQRVSSVSDTGDVIISTRM